MCVHMYIYIYIYTYTHTHIDNNNDNPGATEIVKDAVREKDDTNDKEELAASPLLRFIVYNIME